VSEIKPIEVGLGFTIHTCSASFFLRGRMFFRIAKSFREPVLPEIQAAEFRA
jgi:hypothetical protein